VLVEGDEPPPGCLAALWLLIIVFVLFLVTYVLVEALT
jgi:hypothetical protein